MPDSALKSATAAKGDNQIDSSAPNGIFDYTNKMPASAASNSKGSHRLGLIDPEPPGQPMATPLKPTPAPSLPFDPNQLTDE